MVYVPTPPPISPRARTLAGELEKTIEDFQKRHPDTRSDDVSAALRAASHRGDCSAAGPKWVAVSLGLALLLGGLIFLLAGAQG